MRVAAAAAALVLGGLIAVAGAQDFKGKPAVKIVIQPTLQKFTPGEKLDYVVEWLGIPVGHIFLEVHEMTTFRGRPCYYLSSRSYPNRLFRKIYDLEYRVYSYVDAQTMTTMRFVKIRRINKQFNYVVIDFDQVRHRARYRSWGTSQVANLSGRKAPLIEQQPTSVIKDRTEDLLSAFFYFRTLPCEPGGEYPVNVYYSQSNWPITMKVGQPFVREMRKRGQFQVMNVMITSSLNDFILGKRGFKVCLTVDSRRVPLEFSIGSAVGELRGILRKLPE